MNAAIAKIIANGLVTYNSFPEILGKAIEANPRLAEFLADPRTPEVSVDSILERIKRQGGCEYVSHEVELTPTYEWVVKYTFKRRVFYRSIEEAQQEYHSYRDKQDGDYQIEGYRTDTDFYTLK